MKAVGARTVAYFVVLLLLAANAPVRAQTTPLPGLGMDMGSVAALKQAGAPPEYGSYWVGVWMATSGWGGLDNALKTAKAQGVTPVVYWYYWGDSITPACVENGCDGRTKAQWESMTLTLAERIRTHMGGSPVVVVLENEFNKGGITASSYAPTFDGYLESRTRTLKAVPGVSVSLGFGSWGESEWGRFPKALAAADSVGFQLMRASTRDTDAHYRGAADKIASVLAHVRSISGKAGFLYDLALSSYPDATHRAVQAETLDAILSRRAEYAQAGLTGIVYRELRDNPGMGTHNYYGVAEQYWGFRDTGGVAKPAWDAWRKAAAGGSVVELPPPSPNVPGLFEAESMVASTGGRNSEAGASGGATWNVWTDGDVRQELVSETGGPHRVVVVARGTPALGVDARMEIRLNGTVLAARDVPAGALREYAVNATLPAGRSVLSVAFTNDARTTTEDRNLFVDVVRVDAPPANRPPLASFDAATSGLSLSVDASASSDPDGDALTYRWDFGDGATASGPRASHQYAQAGERVVTLRVSDGATESVARAAVTATQPNRAPSASFDVGGADLTWTFDASSSSDPDGDALTYRWDFGDGANATGPSATHAYAAAGAYAVTLHVSDGRLSASATKDVAAKEPNRAPSAAFAFEGQDLTWSFDASGSTDPEGDALTYSWSFGDGTGAVGVRANKTFLAPGEHAVTLTVGDGALSSTATRVVTARAPNRAPVAGFDASGASMAWSFDASSSSDPDGDALTYSWSFGDGTNATGVRAAKTYDAVGDHVVTLTVSDGRAESTATRTVQARLPNRAPLAAFAAEGADLTWSFDASSSSDPDDDALAYSWSFEDGSSASGVRVSRTFAGPGDHVVRLRVSDGKGLSNETTRVVEARAPAALRAQEAEAFLTKENGAVFGDASASGGRGWLLWGNGAIRQGFAPGAGTYRVEVVAKGDYGAGWPTMELRSDGVTVGRWSVSGSTWATYSAFVKFAPGQARNLSVHFTNDHYAPGVDRNLRVDLVRLAVPGVSVEGEAFSAKDNGAAFSDPSASGGAAWLLWGMGGMRHSFAPGQGAWTVEVVAKGDPAAGWPVMELRSDGVTVGRWTVGSTAWQTYRADVSFTGAAKTLSVHFLNDHRGPEGDRNLRVDVVRVVPK